MRCIFTAICLLSLMFGLAQGNLPAQDRSPQQALTKMTTADGLPVSLVASEPIVRQPVAIDFDDQGRLWVIQYLQYPNPAGLERVQVDRYSRTRYDRVPPPPPHGPQGADRISILMDTDGDGQMDASRDFVSGLNLASGFALGHGGVFVLNVPYLLFYPDRNRDDLPDSDPEVLLSGFGMEDAHSVANSLTFGPDGWLYGCQGSTVTANVRGIEFQQGVWRYHPITKQFELFCEGGGNSWGLDFDATGELLYSTNYGGHVLLHAVQGGYFVKSFAKHGQLHNPFTYGYFDHATHANFQGGHVTVGGMIYQADLLPAKYRGKYIAGDLLGHNVNWHHIIPVQSTVSTQHGGTLLVSNDTWFAPSDLTIGPDGAVYVCDWHDARTAHPDPDAQWDRTNGRIYRVGPTEPQYKAIDLRTLTSDQLLSLHQQSNQWYVRRARQELIRRQDLSVRDALLRGAISHDNPALALESLWTLRSLGQFDLQLAKQLLDSPHPSIRKWTVRLIGDLCAAGLAQLDSNLAHQLDHFAEIEPALEVRQQLACTAARLPAAQALPIINANINRDIDADDQRLPLLWWWAVEKHSIDGQPEVIKRFTRPTLWNSKLGSQFLLPRLIRQYATEGSNSTYDAILQIIEAAVNNTARDALWEPLWIGLSEDKRNASVQQTADPAIQPALPLYPLLARHALGDLVIRSWQANRQNLHLTRLAAAVGHAPALGWARAQAVDDQAAEALRISMFNLLAQLKDGSSFEAALAIAAGQENESIRLAALGVLGKLNHTDFATELIAIYSASSSSTIHTRIMDLLFSHSDSARQFLDAVDAGGIDPAGVPIDLVRRLVQLNDSSITERVSARWGKLTADSPGEILAEIRRLNNDLRAAVGDPVAGQSIFQKHCMNCHQLFGQGRSIGPDLTSSNRQDRDFLLASLVDPSGYIRPEFVTLVIETVDGRILTGVSLSRTADNILLATVVENEIRQELIALNQIEQMQDSPVSIMPADLYKQLSPEDLRNLFAYLQQDATRQ